MYKDNLKQIIDILKIHKKHIIIANLPEISFTPLYYKNSNLISEYNKVIKDLCKSENIDFCDMSGTEKFYVDGVHYTNKGYIELANRWFVSIFK